MAFAGRVLRFPETRPLGHLYNLLPDGSWEDLGRAQGELWTPVAARLHLTVTEPRELASLAGADPHAFHSIDLHHVDASDRQLAPLAGLAGLRRLYLSRVPSAGDGALVHLGRLWALKALTLEHTGVSDAGLGSLSRLRALQELDLAHTRVHGRALGALAALGDLRRLDLSHTRVDDRAVQDLTALPRLEELVLRGTRVTPRGAEALQRSRALRVVGDLMDNEQRLTAAQTVARG